MFKKVLIPVTLHETVNEIISVLDFLIEFGIYDFNFLHVDSSGMGNEKYKNTMNNYVTEIKSKFDCMCTGDIRTGHPATTICNTANENKVDFIYIPSSCKNFLHRTLLGSTTQDVVRLTDKPALIHKCRPHLEKNKKIDTILYATDFGNAANRALPYIKKLSFTKSKLILFHAGKRASDPRSEKKRLDFIEQKLQELKYELSHYFSEIEIRTTIGLAHHSICTKADKFNISLIVIGRFNHNVSGKIIGSTAENVIGKTKSSLLLIP